MYSSIFGNLLLGASLIYGSQAIALQVNTANKDASKIIFLPSFTKHTFEGIPTDKLKKAIKAVEASNEKQLLTKYEHVLGGGYSGNVNTGLLSYDGLPSHLPALSLQRDPKTNTCYLKNKSTQIYQYNSYRILRPVSYECASTNPDHNNLYWNDQVEPTNGVYSLANDALYAGTIITSMYLDWFGTSPLHKDDGSPAPLNIAVNENTNNTYYYNGVLFLDSGSESNFPAYSPQLISSYVAYLINMQNANLELSGKSLVIFYAFIQVAAHAITYYMHDQNDWTLYSEITKSGLPVGYSDQPSKDCGTREPGNNCSIDHLSQYHEGLNPFYASGLYRRAFYLLATTPDWNTKKAFMLMVQANRFYWTSKMGFSKGLCGLIKAARDYHYNESDVINAFDQVGVHVKDCK